MIRINEEDLKFHFALESVIIVSAWLDNVSDFSDCKILARQSISGIEVWLKRAERRLTIIPTEISNISACQEKLCLINLNISDVGEINLHSRY